MAARIDWGVMKFELDFRPKTEFPMVIGGDYLIFSRCTGYVAVEAFFDGGVFEFFHEIYRPQIQYESESFDFWAILPNAQNGFK